MKPSFSVVVALTLIRFLGISNICAIFLQISSRCEPIFGFSQIIVLSKPVMIPPDLLSLFAANFKKMELSSPAHFGSVAGKWEPISSPLIAPSMASVSAWRRVSASECPTSPLLCFILLSLNLT